MKTYLLITIIHTISTIKCANITKEDVLKGNETQQIEALEKQKEKVYEELNVAIADTVHTLEKSNNSLAREGITNLLDLLVLVAQFNDTELNTTDLLTTNITKLIANGRRYMPNHPRSKTSGGFDPIKLAITQMGFIKNEIDLKKVKDEKLKNLIRLEAKLDKWLKMREIEKKKIKEYRVRMASQGKDTIREKCPDFGENKKKGKSDTYPCCRKCCKKSYMGCL